MFTIFKEEINYEIRFHSNSKEMEDIINVTGVSERKWKLDDGNLHLIRPFTIFTSTPDQLARLAETSPKMRNSLREIDSFDIIIVDEASQMDVGHFLPCLLRARATTNGHSKIVIAGDDKQLQPIRKEEIKGTNAVWFGSIYNYFKAYEVSPRVKLIAPVALDVSRRSNHCIIDLSGKHLNIGQLSYRQIQFQRLNILRRHILQVILSRF